MFVSVLVSFTNFPIILMPGSDVDVVTGTSRSANPSASVFADVVFAKTNSVHDYGSHLDSCHITAIMVI